MAKVNIVVDTDEGTIEASVNGKSVDNVKSVSVYSFMDSYGKSKTPEVDVCINCGVEDKDGVRTLTSICAEKGPTGRAAMQIGTTRASYDEFLVNPIIRDSNVSEYSEAKASVEKAFSGIFGKRRTN